MIVSFQLIASIWIIKKILLKIKSEGGQVPLEMPKDQQDFFQEFGERLEVEEIKKTKILQRQRTPNNCFKTQDLMRKKKLSLSLCPRI